MKRIILLSAITLSLNVAAQDAFDHTAYTDAGYAVLSAKSKDICSAYRNMSSYNTTFDVQQAASDACTYIEHDEMQYGIKLSIATNIRSNAAAIVKKAEDERAANEALNKRVTAQRAINESRVNAREVELNSIIHNMSTDQFNTRHAELTKTYQVSCSNDVHLQNLNDELYRQRNIIYNDSLSQGYSKDASTRKAYKFTVSFADSIKLEIEAETRNKAACIENKIFWNF